MAANIVAFKILMIICQAMFRPQLSAREQTLLERPSGGRSFSSALGCECETLGAGC